VCAKVGMISHLYIMSTEEKYNQIFTVGLTGGIGSGKSTVGKVFDSLGVPRFDADKYAHNIYAENREVREAVIERFSSKVAVMLDGTVVDIDRKALGKIAFSDSSALKFLNELVHPAVKDGFDKWLRGLPAITPYVIREAAILFESGSNDGCDKVVTISATAATRIERTIKRDSISKDQVLSIMSKQMTEEERCKKADFIISNDDDDELLPQLQNLHRILSEESLSS
jgi:dephospho-CoA kinase